MKTFVSYAAEDRMLAEEVSLALMGADHDVFIDRTKLEVGDDYHARIRQAIVDCDVFVFLASRASLSAGCYTLTELKLARTKWPHPRGHLLTVRLADVSFAEMPAYLKSVTVLEPEGNVAAEVLEAMANITFDSTGGSSRTKRLALAMLAGAALSTQD